MDERETRLTDEQIIALRLRIATVNDDRWRKLYDRLIAELRTLRSVEPPPEAISLLRLILPMAKGYAHEHPVGSNQQYVTDAEEFIAAQLEAK